VGYTPMKVLIDALAAAGGGSVPSDVLRAAQKGAPNGVATLDAEAKLPRSQIVMAVETENALAAIEQEMEEITPASGDGIAVVGNSINVDIDALTLAP
jgi:hypothetical protein